MDGGVAQRSTRRDRKRERHDYEIERELSKYSKNERENSFYLCRLGILYTAVSGVWRGAPTLCPVRIVPLYRAPRRGPGVGGVPWVYDTLKDTLDTVQIRGVDAEWRQRVHDRSRAHPDPRCGTPDHCGHRR